jgi:hypothetical protein
MGEQLMILNIFTTVFDSVGTANRMNKLSLVGIQLPENI